jgi:hypothetical protein
MDWRDAYRRQKARDALRLSPQQILQEALEWAEQGTLRAENERLRREMERNR